MRKMQERDFDLIEKSCEVEVCSHPEIVKLYDNGTHTDYGCTQCKLKSLENDAFERVGKDAVIRRFQMMYGTCQYVDRTTLLHKNFSEVQISMLISEGFLSESTSYDVNGAFANETKYEITREK